MDESAAGEESSTAYGCLPTMARESYAALKKALKESVELDSRRKLYLSEFSTREGLVKAGQNMLKSCGC